jgi:uncharacterized protein (DUF1697 family)
MNRYVAFLRAVNVGGTTLIKMSDLKRMFESFGFENVETYIQTGNVIFDSDTNKASALDEQIEQQLANAYGKRIRLFIRTTQDVAAMVSACPFRPQDGEAVHVAILEKRPEKKSIDALLSLRGEADDFAVSGKEAFNLRRDREASVFSNNFIERTLDVAATTRNLTTIKKLAEKYA